MDILSALHNPYWWVAILITLVWNTFSVATETLTPYYIILAVITIEIMCLYKLDQHYDGIIQDLRNGKFYSGAKYLQEKTS